MKNLFFYLGLVLLVSLASCSKEPIIDETQTSVQEEPINVDMRSVKTALKLIAVMDAHVEELAYYGLVDREVKDKIQHKLNRIAFKVNRRKYDQASFRCDNLSVYIKNKITVKKIDEYTGEDLLKTVADIKAEIEDH